MSTTVRLPVTKVAYVRKDKPDTHYNVSSANSYVLGSPGKGSGYYRMYFGFSRLPSQYYYYEIDDIEIHVCVKGDDDYELTLGRANDFDAGTVTYNTRPSTTKVAEAWGSWGSSWKDFVFDQYDFDYDKNDFVAFIKKPAFVLSADDWLGSETNVYARSVLADGTAAYINVELRDKVYVKPAYKTGPTGGAYRNPREDITFQWQNTVYGRTYWTWAGSVAQTSAVFHWRAVGESEYHEVAISGTGTSVTIPANTFPVASNIQWYVTTVDGGGTTGRIPERDGYIYQFSTSATEMDATVLYPMNSIEENNAPITFTWNLSSADGFPATHVDLMWKLPDDENWQTLMSEDEPVTSYTVDENTFPVGEIEWLVRANNIDGVQGPDSVGTFVSYGAPDAPVVESDHAPFTTIRWQAENQQGYELEIAGKKYGPYFGTEKAFTLPDYLEDGEYPVRVRIIGTYAVWSLWGELTLYIQNTPGQDVSLTAKTWIDSELSWATEEETSDFLIYRNGKQIGHTTSKSFVDRFGNGEVEYYVVNRLPDGNYSKSNILQKTIKNDCAYIAAAEGGEWLEIRYTLSGSSDPQYQDSRTVTYNQLSGKTYQTPTVSEFIDTTVEFSAVFLYTEPKKLEAFKALWGKPIIVKFPDGWSGVCFIDTWQHYNRKGYYTAYEFTLKQIDWEDYVDE